MILKKILLKIFDKQSYDLYKNFLRREKEKELIEKRFNDEFKKIQKKLDNSDEISFLHSGHIGDVINCLPVIKEISKTHKCNLFIKLKTPLKEYYNDHPAGSFLMTIKQYEFLESLIQKQVYINSIKVYKNEKIDINFDLIRLLPINLLFDNSKYAFHISGVQPNLDEKFLEVDGHTKIKDKIVILRSLRYQNNFISYKFLETYNNSIFVGTYNEYIQLKKIIQNLEFYNCNDLLELSMIIKSSRIFIGNSSLGIDIAEGLKTPRLLEACPYFPARQIHGKNGFDFYFQSHFEKFFKKLYQN